MTFARLALDERTDGLRAVHVPSEAAPLLKAWIASDHREDPVEFLRDQLRKMRLPEPTGYSRTR